VLDDIRHSDSSFINPYSTGGRSAMYGIEVLMETILVWQRQQVTKAKGQTEHHDDGHHG
jgi:hypothetical protein